MNELQGIQAHAQAVITRHRQALEDTRQLIAAPGERVVVIRKPWRVGDQGTVLGVWRAGVGWRALVDFGDRMISVPLDAIARHAGAPDCATAQIWHTAAWIKFQGSEFLE